ncbi:MAG: uracil-DNA glycosylase, family 1 [Candidatus Parcubacteria bacterium]
MEFPPATTWDLLLCDEFKKPYFQALLLTIQKLYLTNIVYPSPQNVFNAFILSSFENTKVVILGQDPYHGAGQAQGLAFSVPDNVKIPPSLKNIYQEMQTDLGIAIPQSGNLEHWAKQGVLLLNTTLTVEKGNPNSHHGLGWETFTDVVIKTISDRREHVVFLLWGNAARSKAVLIDKTKHLVLEAPHPSPFSARSGFFGCNHFSKTNHYLEMHHVHPIVW